MTGGIGSGKSTVASMWVACGAVLVDTDAISRALTACGGAALPALATTFGNEILAPDGALNRDRMRSLVFADVQQRLRLEGILHPMISAQAQAEALAAGSRPVLFDVPLLSEASHWRQRVSRVLVVDCTYQTQVERVMRRNDWPADTVQRIIAQQVPRERRRRIADAVIFNENLGLDELKQEVLELWKLWIAP